MTRLQNAWDIAEYMLLRVRFGRWAGDSWLRAWQYARDEDRRLRYYEAGRVRWHLPF